MADHPFTNRLIKENSPYLLQHAHNPIDWYPWGEDAFNAAKEQDKPIFLSIGYATCHWCHVMERESFQDVHLAQLMNDTFINIKVDREELPEIDSLYMEFAQSMIAGSAGWPLNVLLTPDLQPFFAATYLPPHQAHGLMGLTELIKRIHEVWNSDNRVTVAEQASQIVQVFSSHLHTQGDDIPEKEIIEDTAELLFKMADPIYGGIKGAPKFPIGYQVNFMLHYSAIFKESRALFLVEKTLDMMHRGGIYDHLQGGFSRYSVDEKWLVPHFEKMLYDNALLAHAYLEAWQLTKTPLYKKVCEEILNYILKEMTHSEGGFFSAEDAETEGHEGLYYTWTETEIYSLLDNTIAPWFCEFYGVSQFGNFEGRNILYMKEKLEEFATKKLVNSRLLEKEFDDARKILLDARQKRIHPFKDDKILTSWNGLVIFSLAEASRAFGNQEYLLAAKRAATFIKENMYQDGHLLRRWRNQEARHAGGIDDYAFLIRALLSLFETQGDREWLEWAIELTEVMSEEFKAEKGAFFQTDGKSAHVILRRCQFSDGAEPSGNALHCENLLRLYHLTQDDKYIEEAEDILKAVKNYLESYSPGYCYHLINLMRYYDRNTPTLIIALNREEEYKQELLSEIYKNFIPHKALVVLSQDDQNLITLLPHLSDKKPIDNKTTLYICHRNVCIEPLNDMQKIRTAIHKL